MGCRMSKLAGEPRTIIIKLPSGCGLLPTPHLSSEEHDSEKPKLDSFHAVSLTSTTYGSLRFDPPEDYGEQRIRKGGSCNLMNETSESRSVSRAPNSWSGVVGAPLSPSGQSRDNKKVIPLKGANGNQVQVIDMWELMDGVEDDKATLQMLRALVEKPSISGYESGKSTPLGSGTFHTVEDVDHVLDDRRSLSATYLSRRSSSLEAGVPVSRPNESGFDSDRVVGRSSSMLQKRRARAMQISKEVISELDDLRRRNLSRSHDFSTSGRDILNRSQEFNNAGRKDLSQSREDDSRSRRDSTRSQEFITMERGRLSQSQRFNAAERRLLSQSQDFDSLGRQKYIRSPNIDHVRRGNLFKNQEHDARKSDNAVQSQEFAPPSLSKRREFAARRHSSHEISRIAELKDEKLIAPDILLRSPMLRGVGGVERQRGRLGQEHGRESPLAAAAINVKSTNKPSLRSQTLPPIQRKSLLKTTGPAMVNLDLNS